MRYKTTPMKSRIDLAVMTVIFGLLLGLLCLVIFLIPDSASLLSFSGESLFRGQVWRIITFSLTHIDKAHLIENLAALVLVAFLGYEFDLKGTYFLACFFFSAILIAFADSILFPALIIAGASLGIYAVIGSLSLKGSNFIPKAILIPILGASVFIKYLFSIFSGSIPAYLAQQTLFHFTGFMTGLFMLFILLKLRKKPRLLTGKYSDKETKPLARILTSDYSESHKTHRFNKRILAYDLKEKDASSRFKNKKVFQGL